MVGALSAAVTAVICTLRVEASRGGDAPGPSVWQQVLLWSMLAIPTCQYLAAILLVIRKPTRQLGQGLLIGMTVTLPVALVFAAGVLTGSDMS